MNATNPRIVAIGECMIELRHEAGDLARQAFGGDTLNTSIYLARLAGPAYTVSYATALGADDPYSDAMLAQWTGEGIDTRFVSRVAGALPGLYSIHVDPHGERRFHYWRQNSPARRYLSTDGSPLEARLGDVDLLYFSGISMAILPDEGRTRLFALIERLRARGARIVFDNNYRPRLWSSTDEARRSFVQAYAHADIALMTLSDEQELFALHDTTATQAHIDALPCGELVVKRGAEPTRVRADGRWHEVPTVAVPKVIDTTAAGDSFGAGYLSARLHGLAPQDAARAGNRLAAEVIQHPGAIIPASAMPPLFEA